MDPQLRQHLVVTAGETPRDGASDLSVPQQPHGFDTRCQQPSAYKQLSHDHMEHEVHPTNDGSVNGCGTNV